MPTGREHFALDWIKSELLETLSEARDALEAYAESDRDAALMRTCLTGMHQVHGTLVMLEVEGMALLADHLERLAQQLLNQTVADELGAGQCLMQGILELPGYLDEIQQGRPDTTEPMLPLVNEARRHLGEEPLMGGGVTALSGVLDEAALERFEGIDGIDKAKKIRSAYQQVLLSILKGGDRSRAVQNLSKVAQGLCRVCEGTRF
jgi:chemosensory pili system protein ChpA (sensor histidine kinase/response regulator)